MSGTKRERCATHDWHSTQHGKARCRTCGARVVWTSSGLWIPDPDVPAEEATPRPRARARLETPPAAARRPWAEVRERLARLVEKDYLTDDAQLDARCGGATAAGRVRERLARRIRALEEDGF